MDHIGEYEVHIHEGKKTYQFYSDAQTEQIYEICAVVVIYI